MFAFFMFSPKRAEILRWNLPWRTFSGSPACSAVVQRLLLLLPFKWEPSQKLNLQRVIHQWDQNQQTDWDQNQPGQTQAWKRGKEKTSWWIRAPPGESPLIFSVERNRDRGRVRFLSLHLTPESPRLSMFLSTSPPSQFSLTPPPLSFLFVFLHQCPSLTFTSLFEASFFEISDRWVQSQIPHVHELRMGGGCIHWSMFWLVNNKLRRGRPNTEGQGKIKQMKKRDGPVLRLVLWVLRLSTDLHKCPSAAAHKLREIAKHKQMKKKAALATLRPIRALSCCLPANQRRAEAVCFLCTHSDVLKRGGCRGWSALEQSIKLQTCWF